MALAPRPDASGCALYERDVPVDVLTAVVDGEVVFATRADAAVGRAAVTEAPDGTRWAGMSAVHVAERRGGERPRPRTVLALMAWAAERGAHARYVQVLVDNARRDALYESMGFTAHHRAPLRRRS